MTGLLSIVLAALVCTQPDEFFYVTTNTAAGRAAAAVMSVPVPPRYIYDTVSPSEKVLRVTQGTAAFYYSLLSGYLERDLAITKLGDLRADPDEPGISVSVAHELMQRDNLGFQYLGAVEFLNNATNRIVNGFFRLSEGETTRNLVAAWLDSRHRLHQNDAYAYATPTLFKTSPAASIDFPDINFKDPPILDESILRRVWITWPRLDDYTRRRPIVSNPVIDIADILEDGCELDNRNGAPTQWILNSADSSPIGESVTNVVNTVAPGCWANFTNETMRLDYRRIVALANALHVDDRMIYRHPFGEISIEEEWGFTNFVEVSMTHTITVSVTNFTAGALSYDGQYDEVQANISPRKDGMQILTNLLVVATNYIGYGALASASGTGESEAVTPNSGDLDYVMFVDPSDFTSYVTTEQEYRFAWRESGGLVYVGVYHPAGGVPIAETGHSYGGFFPSNQTPCVISVRRSATHRWSLDPRDVPEKGRVPTALTHDAGQYMPDGSYTEYERNFPKWMCSHDGGLVDSIDIFAAGNVVREWNVMDDEISYLGNDDSLAKYFAIAARNLSYDDAFEDIWNSVNGVRNVVLAEFAKANQAPVGKLASEADPSDAVVEAVSGEWSRPCDPFGIYSTTPSSAHFYDGNFYDAPRGDPSAQVVRVLELHTSVSPFVVTSNVVSRQVSVCGRIGYLGGFNFKFKNLASPDEEE